MEVDTPSKWLPNETGCSHTYIRQNRLQDTKDNERQREAVYNDKGTFHQEDITFINIYAPNIGAPKYIALLFSDLKG